MPLQGSGNTLTNYSRLSVWDLIWAVSISVLAGYVFRACLLKGQYRGNPTNWPVLGMLPGLLINLPHFHDRLSSILINNGGSFSFHGPWLCRMRYFVTADPRNMEHALRTHFHNYPKGEDFSAIFLDLLGHGIFNADHKTWQVQRKITSLHLNSRACKQFTDSTVFDMVEKKLLPTLHHFCKEKTEVDLQDLMLRFTFDAVCMVGFGEDAGSLSPSLPEVPVAKAFEAALECTTHRFLLPASWWRALKWLRLGRRERSMPHALKIINQFSEKMISATKRRLQHNGDINKSDLLSCLMGGDTSIDDKFLKDVAVNLLLAGRDTSALALSWFFWLLAMHPRVQEKVAQESHTIIHTAKEEGKPFLTRAQLHRMHYLHAALTEALRLYPSVPNAVKHVIEDDVFPDGTMVKRDDKFMYSIYTMGRMESIWGSDCASFRPERWLRSCDGTFADTCISPFQYLAFNGGPRTCLGKDMAYLLMKTVASTLLFHFRVFLVPGHKVVPKLSITLYMKHGLLVTLEPRES